MNLSVNRSRHKKVESPVSQESSRYLSGVVAHLLAGTMFATFAGSVIAAVPGDPPEHLPVQSATAASGASDAAEIKALREELTRQDALLQKLMLQRGGASMPAPAEGGAQAKPDAQNALSAPVAAPTPVAPSPLVTAASPPAVTAQSLSPSAVSAPDSVLSVPAQVLPDVPVPAPAIPEAVSSQPPLTDENARRAYASGVSLAGEVLQSLAVQKSLGISLPPDLILAGLQDGFNHKPLRIADDDIRMQVNSLNHDFSARLQARREDEVAQGRQYRQDFRKRKGAFFDAGSLYLVSNKGAPTHLTTSDIATLSIDGTLPDGTVFDGSGQAGQSRKVKVGAMLPAVAIGLQKVGVGGHITVVVPPEKGYGDMGLPPVVPGGSTLIFDITVKGVNESGDAPTEP